MIWLIGDKGMLGTDLGLALGRAGVEHVGTDREVSILDPAALAAFAAGRKIEWIVNCAAYTAVDKAEDEVEANFSINAEGPGNVAALARSIGARMLHLSTDYVFDGKGTSPYREDAPAAPVTSYGKAKAEGEARVRAACPEHAILRTAWLYGEHGPNFVYTMLRLMRAKDRIGVVADQRGSPTWSVDLAAAIVRIATSPAPRFGNYHYTDGGETNWRDFALEIRKLGREFGILARDCEVDALTTDQYPSKARRPAYSVLSKEAIARDYGAEIPDWRASLRRFVGENAAHIRAATEPKQ
jgi:dTDP-4-dehydrorhamnose reductase